MRTHRDAIPAYITKDGSSIRELMHPDVHGNQKQSLAEARVPVGGKTLPHRHEQTEELYHFLQGQGRMHLGEDAFAVTPGDTVHIAPGVAHSVENVGTEELVLLCCCAPPYSHGDTTLMDT